MNPYIHNAYAGVIAVRHLHSRNTRNSKITKFQQHSKCFDIHQHEIKKLFRHDIQIFLFKKTSPEHEERELFDSFPSLFTFPAFLFLLIYLKTTIEGESNGENIKGLMKLNPRRKKKLGKTVGQITSMYTYKFHSETRNRLIRTGHTILGLTRKPSHGSPFSSQFIYLCVRVCIKFHLTSLCLIGKNKV